MKNAITLIDTIWDMGQDAKWVLDKTSLSMDVTVAMNEQQQDDLLAMIYFLRDRGDDDGAILANVLHDTNGLRGVYLEPENFVGFSPRSSGYAERHPLTV